MPLPANADHTFAQLNSVTCPSAKACTAVGSYTGSAGYQGLLVVKSGSAWTATEAPLPKGAAADPYTDITAVSCFSASACAATGSYTDASGNTQALLLTGSGSSWKAVKPPLPAGAAPSSGSVGAPRCVSATSCAVLGGYYDPGAGNGMPYLLTGFGAAWTVATVQLPANTTGGGLSALACTGPSACTAVGTLDHTTSSDGLIVSGFGSSWTATTAPTPSGSSGNESLTDLRCTPAPHCVATGYVAASGGYVGALLSGYGSTWSATAAPLPANAASNPDAQLQTLACPGGTTCTAVGTYWKTGSNVAGLIVTGSGSTWAATQAPLPGNAAKDQSEGGVSITGIACITSGCVIGADYRTASGYNSSALLLGSGSSWSAIQPPIPGNNVAGANIPAVACVNNTSPCIGAGFYVDLHHNDQALLLTGPP